jgi:hypothetical protein
MPDFDAWFEAHYSPTDNPDGAYSEIDLRAAWTAGTQYTAHRWIPISDAMPVHGRNVLVGYRNSQGQPRIVVGMYVGQYEVERSDYGEEWDAEYCATDDTFYMPAGWYEAIENWPDYSSVAIDSAVTHWQPLPEAPA